MKLFQITEDDLAELERPVPSIMDAIYPHLNPMLKAKFRICQRIITDVRWNYDPLQQVETQPADGDIDD